MSPVGAGTVLICRKRYAARYRRAYLFEAYPGGESWAQAVARVQRFLVDLPLRWDGTRVLVIGHVATRWGLECALGSGRLEELVDQEFVWQEGWEYRLG